MAKNYSTTPLKLIPAYTEVLQIAEQNKQSQITSLAGYSDGAHTGAVVNAQVDSRIDISSGYIEITANLKAQANVVVRSFSLFYKPLEQGQEKLIGHVSGNIEISLLANVEEEVVFRVDYQNTDFVSCCHHFINYNCSVAGSSHHHTHIEQGEHTHDDCHTESSAYTEDFLTSERGFCRVGIVKTGSTTEFIEGCLVTAEAFVRDGDKPPIPSVSLPNGPIGESSFWGVCQGATEHVGSNKVRLQQSGTSEVWLLASVEAGKGFPTIPAEEKIGQSKFNDFRKFAGVYEDGAVIGRLIEDVNWSGGETKYFAKDGSIADDQHINSYGGYIATKVIIELDNGCGASQVFPMPVVEINTDNSTDNTSFVSVSAVVNYISNLNNDIKVDLENNFYSITEGYFETDIFAFIGSEDRSNWNTKVPTCGAMVTYIDDIYGKLKEELSCDIYQPTNVSINVNGEESVTVAPTRHVVKTYVDGRFKILNDQFASLCLHVDDSDFFVSECHDDHDKAPSRHAIKKYVDYRFQSCYEAIPNISSFISSENIEFSGDTETTMAPSQWAVKQYVKSQCELYLDQLPEFDKKISRYSFVASDMDVHDAAPSRSAVLELVNDRFMECGSHVQAVRNLFVQSVDNGSNNTAEIATRAAVKSYVDLTYSRLRQEIPDISHYISGMSLSSSDCNNSLAPTRSAVIDYVGGIRETVNRVSLNLNAIVGTKELGSEFEHKERTAPSYSKVEHYVSSRIGACNQRIDSIKIDIDNDIKVLQENQLNLVTVDQFKTRLSQEVDSIIDVDIDVNSGDFESGNTAPSTKGVIQLIRNTFTQRNAFNSFFANSFVLTRDFLATSISSFLNFTEDQKVSEREKVATLGTVIDYVDHATSQTQGHSEKGYDVAVFKGDKSTLSYGKLLEFSTDAQDNLMPTMILSTGSTAMLYGVYKGEVNPGDSACDKIYIQTSGICNLTLDYAVNGPHGEDTIAIIKSLTGKPIKPSNNGSIQVSNSSEIKIGKILKVNNFHQESRESYISFNIMVKLYEEPVVPSSLNIDDHPPIAKIQTYNDISNSISTNMPCRDYEAAIVSFESTAGNIDQFGNVDIMKMWLSKEDKSGEEYWKVDADFASHKRGGHEKWNVRVMFFEKHLITDLDSVIPSKVA